jgi:polyhydroxybutyrate depolymerase
MQALASKVCGLILLAVVPLVSRAAEPRLMTWDIDGTHREALVFAPSAGAPNDKHPLIFVFHGHGGNMRGFARHTALAQHWPEAIVVVPQGLNTPSARDPNGRKPGWQRLAGGSNADLKLFDAMLTSMHHEFSVDDRRVFATGFSNGAFFSLLLWIERGDRLAAVSIVAGALDPSQHLTTPKPVLHIAGDKDPLVTPAKVAVTVAEERRADGAEGQSRSCGERCTLYHGTRDDVKFITHPGGHEYPKAAAGWTVEFFKSLRVAPN